MLWFVSGVCTMGGIDGYVLTFTLLPICLVMAQMCDIPRRFIPAMFCLNCAFMTAPGAPQIYNIMGVAATKSAIPQFEEQGAFGIVAQLAGVSSTSAWLPGLVSTIIITSCGVATLIYMINKAIARGEHFDYGEVQAVHMPDRKLPNFVVALLPLVLVFVLYTIVRLDVFIALLGGILLAFIIMFPNLPKQDIKGNAQTLIQSIVGTLNGGANSYPNALLTVATPAGLAGVITATAAFGMIVGLLSGLQMNPIILAIVVVCVIVAITSAPPVALMVAIPMVLGIAAGPIIATAADVATAVLPVSAGAIMRVSVIAASTFETLPVNGLIILGLHLTKTTHKQAYLPMFLMTVAYTFLGTIVAAALCLAFPAIAV